MIKTADIIDGYRRGKVTSATLIKMAAFKHEIEKTAVGQQFYSAMKDSVQLASKDMLPNMLAMTGVMGIGTAIHEGVKVLEGMYQDYKLSQEKMPAYNAMLKQHPDLSENPELTKVYFDALWHYSPTMAEEPLSAGAYIKNALNMHHVAQGPLPSVVKEVVDIEKAHSQASDKGSNDGGAFGNIFLGLKTGPGAYAMSQDNIQRLKYLNPGAGLNKLNPNY